MQGLPQGSSGPGEAPDMVLTQEEGRAWEELAVGVLESMGRVVVDRQVELPPEYFVTGHPDGRFEQGSGSTDPTVGVEFKHLGRWAFEKILKDGFEDAKPDYVLQATLYGHSLGWDEVFWMVASQDASSIKSDMRINREAKNPAVRWAQDQNPKLFFHQLDLHPLYSTLIPIAKKRAEWLSANKNTLIEREYDPTRGKFPCTYCPYLERCLKDGPGGQRAPRLPFGVSD